MIKKTLFFALLSLTLFGTSISAFAGEEAAIEITSETIDDAESGNWIENEITNSFYVPKSAFHSTYDYQEYCERMYKNGYMDEYYNWTDEAMDYINNPTKEKSEALDVSAKALVEERIEEGLIAPEDNPFLTYEEREALKEAASTTPAVDETDPGEYPETEEPDTDEIGATSETDSEASTEETSDLETESETWSDTHSSNSIGRFIVALIITGLAMVIYYFYRKRNT